MKTDPKSMALVYLDAVAKKELGKLQELLAPDLKFTGPAIVRSTAQEFINALKRREFSDRFLPSADVSGASVSAN